MKSRKNQQVDQLNGAIVGAFDVDKTLLNLSLDEDSFVLNEALLDAYKELGIKDIFLFTNMDMGTLDREFQPPLPMKGTKNLVMAMSRAEIVTDLEERGFIVHAVVTPPDVGYIKDGENQGLGAVYKDFYLPQYQRFVEREIKPYECFEDTEFEKADRQVKEFNAAGNNNEKLNELANEIGFDLEAGQNAKDKDSLDKAFNVKGNLFDYTMENVKPSCFVYADDEFSPIVSVQQVAKVKHQNTNLICLHVENSKDAFKNPFRKENYEEMKDKYKQTIWNKLTASQKQSLEQGKQHFQAVRTPSFFKRHPILKRALIGAAIATGVLLVGAAIIAAMAFSGGAAALIVAPVVAVAATTAASFGVAGTIGAALGLTIATASFGASIGTLTGVIEHNSIELDNITKDSNVKPPKARRENGKDDTSTLSNTDDVVYHILHENSPSPKNITTKSIENSLTDKFKKSKFYRKDLVIIAVSEKEKYTSTINKNILKVKDLEDSTVKYFIYLEKQDEFVEALEYKKTPHKEPAKINLGEGCHADVYTRGDAEKQIAVKKTRK